MRTIVTIVERCNFFPGYRTLSVKAGSSNDRWLDAGSAYQTIDSFQEPGVHFVRPHRILDDHDGDHSFRIVAYPTGQWRTRIVVHA